MKITEDPEEAAIWAASANHLIEPVPAADEIVEYRAMQGRGASLAEIALAFGQSEAHIRRRLALAGLPDDVIAALRAARSPSNMRRSSRLRRTLPHRRGARRAARRAAVGIQPAAFRGARGGRETDRRARFVGLDAYAAAGGRIAHDLFEDRRHLTDPALLDRLAAEKLDAAAAAMVAGGAWAWVETCAEAHVSWAEIEKGLAARVYPVEGDLTEAEASATRNWPNWRMPMCSMPKGRLTSMRSPGRLTATTRPNNARWPGRSSRSTTMARCACMAG
ncbi:MAG: hypothetical protein JKP98_03725 [Rhodobacteraceae bacterium]|nr:hypothetical protein [Paracoccaceae bacterium]